MSSQVDVASPQEILNDIQRAADALKQTFGAPPVAAITLGSGLGPVVERLADPVSVPYAALGLPPTGVAGHAGAVVVGELGGARVALLSGRVHVYEGRPLHVVVRAVRAMARWGAARVVLTSAVGGVDPSLRPGDVVLISDHMNFMGENPLAGAPLSELGPRFPDLTHAYHPGLRAEAMAAAEALGLPLRSGVYAAMRGPSYETPAEVRMVGQLGAAVVGMSMAPEVIALAHMGVPTLGLSIVSNLGAGLSDEPMRHEDVTAEVGKASARAGDLLERLCAGWA